MHDHLVLTPFRRPTDEGPITDYAFEALYLPRIGPSALSLLRLSYALFDLSGTRDGARLLVDRVDVCDALAIGGQRLDRVLRRLQVSMPNWCVVQPDGALSMRLTWPMPSAPPRTRHAHRVWLMLAHEQTVGA